MEEVARPYFDDILMGTRREPGMDDAGLRQRHAKDVREVMLLLEKDKWVADRAKARMFMKRVEFCGHVLGGGKRIPAPGKLAAVQQWQLPTTVTALRAFLGLCNYYAGYVRMFAELAAPLMEKLKAGSKHQLDWT